MSYPDFKGELGRKLVVQYANLNGISGKSEEVKRWTEEGKADIVAIVETMAGPATADCLFCDLDLYNLHRLDRINCQKATGGGVALIIKKDIQAIRMEQYEVPGLEVLWVKIVALRKNMMIGVLYAPGYDIDAFDKLRSSMELIPPFLRQSLLLLGDFNCPNIDWNGSASASSEKERDLLSLQKEFKLWQRINQDTRRRGNSSSTLDLVFVSQLGLIRDTRIIKPPTDSNDHYGIRCKILLWTPKIKTNPKVSWKIDDEGARKFRTSLASVDWGKLFDLQCNSDAAVSVFQETILSAAKSSFQLRSIGSRRLHRPTLSGTAVESLRKCRGAFKQWRRTTDPADLSRWKGLEAAKKKILRRERYHRLRNIATSSRKNPKAVWNFLKKNTASNSIPPIPVPGSNDKYLVYPQDKAEFISKSFAKEYADCPTHCLTHSPPSQACQIEPPSKPHCPELLVTTSAVLATIRELDANKASGSSLITNRLLKIAGTTVVDPLARLFNLFLSTGKFPTAWKKADVVPVPKKGGSAFRPISLLSPLSKLFEKILADHITYFMNSNRLFADTQFGFRRKRSTEMQLLQMSHKWTQILLERKEADIIFLDCTKAFDRLPHDVIITGLSRAGVKCQLQVLIADYLRGRSQRVVVDGFYSEESAVKSGVPQGSILGPLLFNIAVNSLSSSVLCEVLQYADDIVIWRKVGCEDDCQALQKDLDSLFRWCSDAGLEINPKKSQHLRLSNKTTRKAEVSGGNYLFSTERIPTVAEAECLGVTFSNKMGWTAQADNVTSKSRRRLYAIKAFFPQQFGSVKQLLFKSLVRSVVDYGSSSWHSVGKGHQKQLEGIQKKFLRSIRLGKMVGRDQHDGDFAQYRQHLAEVGWQPLWKRRLEGILINAFKIWSGAFAGGSSIMKKELPARSTRSQAKEMLLEPVSQAPRSCKMLESTSSSFAYVAASVLRDPLFNPSPRDLLTLGSFKAYLCRLKFSDFKWCKENIDVLLIV